jgi:hypothetical protein
MSVPVSSTEDAAEAATTFIHAHSQGWQLVMQEMMAWVQHHQGQHASTQACTQPTDSEHQVCTASGKRSQDAYDKRRTQDAAFACCVLTVHVVYVNTNSSHCSAIPLNTSQLDVTVAVATYTDHLLCREGPAFCCPLMFAAKVGGVKVHWVSSSPFLFLFSLIFLQSPPLTYAGVKLEHTTRSSFIHSCLLLQAKAAPGQDAPEEPAAAPESQQHGSTSGSAIEQVQPLLAVESVAAAGVAIQSQEVVPAAAASAAAPFGPDTAVDSAAAAQNLDTTELAAACIDAHSRGWQLVMQEMVAWVQHKQGDAQQQQQQPSDEPDTVQPIEGLTRPKQVWSSCLLDGAC